MARLRVGRGRRWLREGGGWRGSRPQSGARPSEAGPSVHSGAGPDPEGMGLQGSGAGPAEGSGSRKRCPQRPEATRVGVGMCVRVAWTEVACALSSALSGHGR